VAFEHAGQLARVVRCQELLAQFRPDSDLAPQARLSVARTYHGLALFRDASDHYENFAQTYSDEDGAIEALANAAIFRQGLGEYDAAIADYESFIELFPDEDEQVAEAFFRIGIIYEDRGELRDAARQFERYLSRHAGRGRPGLALQAAGHLGVMAWTQGDRAAAEAHFIDVLDRYNGLADDERNGLDPISLDAAAQSRFMLGEGLFEQFSQIEIAGDETQVQETLREKTDIGRQAGQVYEQVRAFARPGWSIAAFTRLGQLYHEFYDSIVNAPVPEGLALEVEEAYLTMLEEQGTEVRLQAISYYETALEIARTAGWFNEYSSLSEQNLSQLDPSFRAGNEVRANPGYEPFQYFSAEFAQTIGEADEAEPEDEAATGAGPSAEAEVAQ